MALRKIGFQLSLALLLFSFFMKVYALDVVAVDYQLPRFLEIEGDKTVYKQDGSGVGIQYMKYNILWGSKGNFGILWGLGAAYNNILIKNHPTSLFSRVRSLDMGVNLSLSIANGGIVTIEYGGAYQRTNSTLRKDDYVDFIKAHGLVGILYVGVYRYGIQKKFNKTTDYTVMTIGIAVPFGEWNK